MKNKVMVFVLIILTVSCNRNHNNFRHIDSSQANNTLVTPYLKSEIKKGKNIVFCSTFKIAWDSLKNTVLRSNIVLENQPVLAEHLNSGLSSTNDLSKSNYIALAGFVKDGIVSEINTQLKQKFPTEKFNVSNNVNDSGGIISFSYLYKNLMFKQEFEKIDNPIEFNDSSKKIKCFGVNKFDRSIDEHEKILEQFEVCDYKNEDDFIIKITPKGGKDEIVLAKIKPKKSLLDTIIFIRKRIKNSDKEKHPENYYLSKKSTIQIPVFNFNISHEYRELLNKKVQNRGFTKYFFAKAQQDILFKLDEKGALLKSFSFTFMKKSASSKPLRFIFNKPFMLYLKEKNGKYPYFVMWVNNNELMVKSD